MGDFRGDCCENDNHCNDPCEREKCYNKCYDKCQDRCRDKCYDDCCDDNNSWGILILLIVLYLLFCNNNGKGGFLGGLF
ncbi:MAG TPA: hypothetical protein VJY37_01155 [Anaerovoracaceae bacterium]|nr:hypothetical protein [Anaerovoracaceae bacterium]